jgi:predicted dehydrogenase
LVEGIVSMSDFDAAVVATPAHFHVSLARRCARQGLHVLVEKPIAAKTDGIEELIAECKRSGLVLAVGYVLRFHPALAHTRDLISAGALGRVLSVRAVCTEQITVARPRYREGYFRLASTGGGVILDLSHEVNYLEWLFGPLWSEASQAAVVPEIGVPTEAVANLVLRDQKGTPISVHLHEADWRVTRQCHIAGTEASLTADLIDGTVTLWRAGGSERFECREEPDSWFLNQARDFLDAIACKRLPRCTGEEALETLRLCLSALGALKPISPEASFAKVSET